ncbi:MAG TPA: outer membrane beta-barrel protein [Vicinamibacterales bacterium]|nr:outer membrane beta-barrel protein [Vicinamibacterales bacterium]
MRWGALKAVALLAVAALVFAAPASAEERWALNANVGSAFGNIGTTFLASGWLGYRVNDTISLAGEFGLQPHAPFDKADEIASPLPGVVQPSELRVNGYHANVNAFVYPARTRAWRIAPYITGGIGAFTADTIGWRNLSNGRVEERRRQTDFATNVGAGLAYPLTDWVRAQADYRTFFVHRPGDTRPVHRFTTGLTFAIR